MCLPVPPHGEAHRETLTRASDVIAERSSCPVEPLCARPGTASFEGQYFDAETIRVMGVAFEATRCALDESADARNALPPPTTQPQPTGWRVRAADTDNII
jgi:hypothetical protein